VFTCSGALQRVGDGRVEKSSPNGKNATLGGGRGHNRRVGRHRYRAAGVRRAAMFALVGGATVAAGLAVAVPVARADDPPPAGSIGGIPIPPLPIPPILTPPAPEPKPTHDCSTARQPFVPSEINFADIADGIRVLPTHRVDGHPGTPPLTSVGKRQAAFDLDSGIKPGDPEGNSLFNVHTWPDGSALGNRLLAELHKGDRITVRGDTGRICYRVTDRVEVSEHDPGKRYYATTGSPQIAIVACSGRRVGPEHWTMRTIWYASPVR
jgi:hypothetical protein